jgi:hypothetical protein
MPVWKFSTLAEASAAEHRTVPAEVALRTALALSQLDEASRRGIRISQTGVVRYRTVAEGETHRERYALARLRARAEGPSR